MPGVPNPLSNIRRVARQSDTRSDVQKQAEFFAAYMEDQSIERAAKKANIGVSLINRWRAFDEAFAESFKEIIAQMILAAEEELFRRAVKGVDRPVFQGGVQVGTVKDYSDQLLMFFLKANRPKKYREKLHVQGKATNTNNNVLILPSNGRELENEVTQDAETVNDDEDDFIDLDDE